jgi:hypothetical protein
MSSNTTRGLLDFVPRPLGDLNVAQKGKGTARGLGRLFR